jgi:hypothetical protein
MLTERQKNMLKKVARLPEDKMFGKENPALELVITQIMLENSLSFLFTDEDFRARNFYHKPMCGPKVLPFNTFIEEFSPERENGLRKLASN